MFIIQTNKEGSHDIYSYPRMAPVSGNHGTLSTATQERPLSAETMAHYLRTPLSVEAMMHHPQPPKNGHCQGLPMFIYIDV